MSEKRTCIFTGKESDTSLLIVSGKTEIHNWSKKVPCTKEYEKKLQGRPLNDLEFSLVEIFYKKEVCRLKIENYENQMIEIRKKINDNKETIQEKVEEHFEKKDFEFYDESIDPVTSASIQELMEKVGEINPIETDKVKKIKQKKTLWD